MLRRIFSNANASQDSSSGTWEMQKLENKKCRQEFGDAKALEIKGCWGDDGEIDWHE
jgi:hypothetical protein